MEQPAGDGGVVKECGGCGECFCAFGGAVGHGGVEVVVGVGGGVDVPEELIGCGYWWVGWHGVVSQVAGERHVDLRGPCTLFRRTVF